MPTIRDQIKQIITNLLKENPRGMRHSEIFHKIREKLPSIPGGTIVGGIRFTKKSGTIYRPSRGLYMHTSFREREEKEDIEPRAAIGTERLTEEDFYQPFADYLVDDLEECTRAIVLGGNRFGPRWGTPDVIGKNESGRTDIIKHEPEIISAEIKIDTAALITAFGQACAYRLFSHKVYIVIPKNSPEDDKLRVESLCLIFGIGLVLFDEDKENPVFEIRVRSLKHEPDSFYVNKYMRIIEQELFS